MFLEHRWARTDPRVAVDLQFHGLHAQLVRMGEQLFRRDDSLFGGSQARVDSQTKRKLQDGEVTSCGLRSTAYEHSVFGLHGLKSIDHNKGKVTYCTSDLVVLKFQLWGPTSTLFMLVSTNVFNSS